MMRFVKGESYWAIPCLEGAPRKVVTVAGRGSCGIIFSQPSETVPQTEWSREIEGRETARVMLPDGAYTVSAASVCAFGEALEVMAVVRPQGFKRAARRFLCRGSRDA